LENTEENGEMTWEIRKKIVKRFGAYRRKL
jgi:hypothetical protein